MTQGTFIKIAAKRLISISLVVSTYTLISCDRNDQLHQIPRIFQPYIAQKSSSVAYKALATFQRSESPNIPESISVDEALNDIDMLEYLVTTSYSGYEYWEKMGVDFEAYFDRLRSFVHEKQIIDTYALEEAISSILEQFRDGHISFVGEGYHGAYHHKAVYYSDVLIEKTSDGQYEVINSKNRVVETGSIFTELAPETYLFQTLSAPGKDQYLLGVFSYKMISNMELSFNGNLLDVPFHKSRLLNARFEDHSQYYITQKNDIPVLRITGFADALYPQFCASLHKLFHLRIQCISKPCNP